MVVRKDIDNCTAVLAVTVTRDVLKPKLDEELKRLRHKMPVKGFRPGQVPMDYLKKMYGSAVFSETLNDLFSEELVAYLRESGLNILGQPLPVEEQSSKFSLNISNPDPEYVIEYEVGFVPKIEIQGIDKDHSYERLTISNLDQLAEEDLEYGRKRMGRTTQTSDSIEAEDILRIAARELESETGGPKADGWETTISIFMKNVADEALKASFIGLKTGDSLRFNARLIETFSKEEMYRKYILSLPDHDEREVGDWFEGTIEEVSRVADAELDETFFNDYFGEGVSNKSEAIEKLKEGILGFYDLRSNALLFRTIQERLLELNKIELPEKFLKRWLEVTNRDRLNAEQIEREFPAFVDNLRWSIIRDELLDKYSVTVTDAELEAVYAQRVRNYFQAAIPDHIIQSSVKRLMEDKKDVESTQQQLESDKLLEAIRKEVSIEDKAVTSDEFHTIMESVTARAKAEQEQGSNLITTLEEEGE